MAISVRTARQVYAEELRFTANVISRPVIRAFATVPREHFVGPGPWRDRALHDARKGRGRPRFAADGRKRQVVSTCNKGDLHQFVDVNWREAGHSCSVAAFVCRAFRPVPDGEREICLRSTQSAVSCGLQFAST